MKRLFVLGLLFAACSPHSAVTYRGPPIVRPPPVPMTTFAVSGTRYGFEIPRDDQWKKKYGHVAIEGRPPEALIASHPKTGAQLLFNGFARDDMPIETVSKRMAIRLGLGGAKTTPLDLAKYGGKRSGFRFTRFFGDVPVLTGQVLFIRVPGDEAHVIMVQGIWVPRYDVEMTIEMNAALATLRVVKK
jgi:hypothetical protein